MNKQIAVTVAVACLCGGSSFAQAQAQQQSGWYAGGAFGRSSVSISNSDMAATSAYLGTVGVTGITTSKKENDSGFKFLVGYQLNPNISFEGGYADLGKFDAKFNGTFGGGAGSATASMEATTWYGDVVFTGPISREFAVFGKLGINAIRAEGKAAITWPGFTGSVTQSKTNTGGHYGLGMTYAVTPQVGIRGEWERFKGAKITSQSSEGDINMYSIGLQVRF